MTRRVHVIHVVEKNIMTSTGCSCCSALESVLQKKLLTKHWHTTSQPGLQERRLSFKRFTELFDLQSISVCHLVTSKLYETTHLGFRFHLAIFKCWSSRKVTDLRILRIVSGSPSHPAFGSMSLQGPHLKQNKRHKSVLDSFATMNILISSEWHPFKTEHEEFAISTWRTIERFWG